MLNRAILVDPFFFLTKATMHSGEDNFIKSELSVMVNLTTNNLCIFLKIYHLPYLFTQGEDVFNSGTQDLEVYTNVQSKRLALN